MRREVKQGLRFREVDQKGVADDDDASGGAEAGDEKGLRVSFVGGKEGDCRGGRGVCGQGGGRGHRVGWEGNGKGAVGREWWYGSSGLGLGGILMDFTSMSFEVYASFIISA